MKSEIKLLEPVETYVHAINTLDEKDLASSFAQDAVVKDVGRELHGVAAITEWARHEIFAANVSLELMNAVERGEQTILTVKIDGTSTVPACRTRS